MPTLIRLYAVTISGAVYLLREPREGDEPIVEKVHQAPHKKSKRLVGTSLSGGHYVGISNYGLWLYSAGFGSPDRSGRPLRLEQVNREFVGDSTTRIAALFMELAPAIDAAGQPQLEPYDQRFRLSTDEALREVGDDHEYFVLSQGMYALTTLPRQRRTG